MTTAHYLETNEDVSLSNRAKVIYNQWKSNKSKKPKDMKEPAVLESILVSK